MLGNPARILCIGKDSGLLRSRCAVLTHAGYHAEAVMFAEAESLLRTAEFDLIILSAILRPRRGITSPHSSAARFLSWR